MTVGHEELEQALIVHDQHPDEDDGHGAHGFIGHLLTHMPMTVSAIISAPLHSGSTGQPVARTFSFSPGVPEPPFRPPRVLFG